MLGWYIDCLEKLLQDKFGVGVWKSVKAEAGVSNDSDNGRFEQLERYEDSITWKLLESACGATGLSREELLEALGEFFFHSQCTCQPQPQDSFCTTYAYSDNLQDWLSNYSCVNQTLWSPQVSQQLPQFFCQQQQQQNQSLLLHCYTPQGSLWTHFVQGFVSEAAAFLFHLQIQMQPLQDLQTQDSFIR
jgi:Haem-NO-binding